MDTINTNIKERILQIANNKGVSYETFLSTVDLKYSNFKGRQKNSGLNSKSIETLISKYPDIDLHWLITGEHKKESSMVHEPALAYLTSLEQHLKVYEDLDEELCSSDIQYCIPEFTHTGVTFLFKIRWNNMIPNYKNGDLIGCKVIDTTTIEWGRAYIIKTSEQLLFKRLFPVAGHPDKVSCKSDDAIHYPAFELEKKNILKLALVNGLVRCE